MSVHSSQRFTRHQPCPICAGFDDAPRSKGVRCFGFLSDDGGYAHCSREEFAEGLRFSENSQTFAHKLEGDCRCGTRHDPSPAAVSVKKEVETTYRYADEHGKLLFEVVRFKPKDFRQRRPDGSGGRTWNVQGVRRVLYRLPEVVKAEQVFVVEGERDADMLASWGVAATTNPGGAGKWKPEYSEFLRGKRAVIIPDADEPGRRHALDVASSLLGVAAEVRIVELPGAKDVSAWSEQGGSRELLGRLAQDAQPTTRDSQETLRAKWLPAQGVTAATKTSERAAPQKDLLLELAATASLFRTQDGTAFADTVVNGHRETWPVRSRSLKLWLGRRYYEKTGSAPSREAREVALDTLQAKALFDAPERPVALRVAEYKGKLYLDLCNEAWQAVEIDVAGWRVIDDPPVRFRRTPGMQPLPVPVSGGSVNELRPFLNVGPGGDFALVVAWLLASLRPNGPFPVLVLLGEHGAAKSTSAEILRSLVDPSGVPLRSLSRDSRDLFIYASNAHVLAFDNVSGLPPWLSDALCIVASGGGFATRLLFTDDEEKLFAAARPVMLNGIDGVATRPDLADRAIFLALEPIPDERRLPEDELWAGFERARPKILGALLDAVAVGLRELPNTRLERLPRMADFALWAMACEGALWEPGAFARAYESNRADATESVVEADTVADSVRALMAERDEWEGAASELLNILGERVGARVTQLKFWPASPRALSSRLRRAAPSLRKLGVEITFGRLGNQRRSRVICISAAAPTPPPEKGCNFASTPSEPSEDALSGSIINNLASDASMDAKRGLDANSTAAVRANSLRTNALDGVDATDAKLRTFAGGPPGATLRPPDAQPKPSQPAKSQHEPKSGYLPFVDDVAGLKRTEI